MKRIILPLLCAALLSSCGAIRSVLPDQGDSSRTPSTQATGQQRNTGRTRGEVARSSGTRLLQDTGVAGVSRYTLSDIGSKELTAEEQKQLSALAREIKAVKDGQVTVIGHSDNIGTGEVNQAVSRARARLVADFLKDKGVPAGRITVRGESYNHPVAGNDTAAGRAKNRRVEIYVSPSGVYNPYR